MTIPDFQTIMLPLLEIALDGAEHRYRDVVDTLAERFSLSDDERAEMLPSGGARLFDNRVGWAQTYLKRAGLISSVRRGVFQITETGRQFVAEKPERITVSLLAKYSSSQANKGKEPKESVVDDVVTTETKTPEDMLAFAYQQLRASLESELLEQIKASSPAFFERLVVDLLVAMGYGGSIQDAGKAIGKSGDGGIDGIIKEDKLGLDAIYIQAKRWDGNVGRPEIQKFAGALQGQRANKGVFITTSGYTKEALDYVKNINTKIILVDGEQLANLMVDHNVGVSLLGVYELKKIDTDYFEGE